MFAPTRPRNRFIPCIETLKPLMYWTLFEDLFDFGDGVTRRVLPPAKDAANPLLAPERPWESSLAYPSVLRDPETGRWRMWYGNGHGEVCLAESDDGAHWERPALGLVEFGGSRANNICLAKPPDKSIDGPCVFLDPVAPPEERYKLAVAHHGRWRDDSGMALYGSPDGVGWTLLKWPVITGRFDCQCTMLRDPVSGKLLCFHRPAFIVRTVAQSQSDDGRCWTGHNHWLVPDVLDTEQGLEHYSLAVFPYDGHLLGFSKIYANRWYDKRCWIEVVGSRDVVSYNPGEAWWRSTDRSPFIATGPEDAWDSFRLAPGHGLVWDEPADGHWLYYHCVNALHTKGAKAPDAKGRIGRAFVRRRRFHEFYADDLDAYVRTVPLLFEGEHLTLDYRCEGGSEIRAEVLRSDNRPAPGFARRDSSALRGEAHEGRIAFAGGTLRRLAGEALQAVFHMGRGAHLYAFGVL